MSEPALPSDIVDAAITWVVKLDYNDAAPETRGALERWLRADPRHVLAWHRVTSLKTRFASFPPDVLRATLDAADARRDRRVLSRRNALKLLSFGGIALGTGLLVREYTPWQRLLADASTATGEQKSMQLSDGTSLMLNTDSAASADLTGERRIVILRRGEIAISTGAEPEKAHRPFWVYTPFGRMQALGTRFTVRLSGARARISVQEGAVELHPSSGATSQIVRAGESRWLSDTLTQPADTRGFEPDSWTDGVIAGKNLRLADLLDELSRYRHGRIACDERVADLRVSGVFHIRNTDQALRFLAQTQPVRVVYRTRFWVSVEPSG